MAVNKVEVGGNTLMDLTSDTVTPDTLAEGATAHNAAGERIVGLMSVTPAANGTLTIKRNGIVVGTFVPTEDAEINIAIPTKVSELTNDSGFITNAGVTGVKGNAESSYRTGQVNITPANIGLGNVNNTADSAKSVSYATSAGSATNATNATNASKVNGLSFSVSNGILSVTY